MKNRRIFLHPFKFDKSDRGYDIIRGAIIFRFEYCNNARHIQLFLRELIRIQFAPDKIKNAVLRSRLDLEGFRKLSEKFNKISITTIKKLAAAEQINIIIYTRISARSKMEKMYETSTEFQHSMHLQAKFYNEAHQYSLSNLTMLLNPDFEVNTYNSLQNKIKITTWTSAMRYEFE